MSSGDDDEDDDDGGELAAVAPANDAYPRVHTPTESMARYTELGTRIFPLSRRRERFERKAKGSVLRAIPLIDEVTNLHSFVPGEKKTINNEREREGEKIICTKEKDEGEREGQACQEVFYGCDLWGCEGTERERKGIVRVQLRG